MVPGPGVNSHDHLRHTQLELRWVALIEDESLQSPPTAGVVASGNAQPMPTTGPPMVVLAGEALIIPGPAPTSTLHANVQSGACVLAVTICNLMDDISLDALLILGAGPVARKVRNNLELDQTINVVGDRGVGQALARCGSNRSQGP